MGPWARVGESLTQYAIFQSGHKTGPLAICTCASTNPTTRPRLMLSSVKPRRDQLFVAEGKRSKYERQKIHMAITSQRYWPITRMYIDAYMCTSKLTRSSWTSGRGSLGSPLPDHPRVPTRRTPPTRTVSFHPRCWRRNLPLAVAWCAIYGYAFGFMFRLPNDTGHDDTMERQLACLPPSVDDCSIVRCAFALEGADVTPGYP